MKRPFSLRTWMLIGIPAMVIVPWLLTAAFVLLTGLFEPAQAQEPAPPLDPAAWSAIYREVEGQPDRWADPAWQTQITTTLESEKLAVWIDLSDKTIILPPLPSETTNWAQLRQAVIYQGRQEVGTVTWKRLLPTEAPATNQFIQWQDRFMQTVIALLILGTIWAAIALASRAILRPLRALSDASARINAGQLDFAVPASPVAEVDQLAHSFDMMRNGLKDSIAQQAAMEQERRLFIAAVAHDLRTPLASIRGYLEGLRDGIANTPERRERYVAVALEKSGTLEHLIDSFFTYAKAEYLTESLQPEPLDLGELLTAAVEALRPMAAERSLTLALDPAPEPCPLLADPHALSRVVDNLLENALRYTPPGGAVTVGWRRGVEHARFWVQDNGPGIPPADLPRLFQPLYRGDKARGSRTGGAGLGLAIARRLVEAHCGEISAANQGGACFTVTLPLG